MPTTNERISEPRSSEVASPRRGRAHKTAAGAARRDELVMVAARHFRLKGFTATTMREIASDSGMQSGSPFYHFKSKKDLLFAVMEEGMHSALQGQEQVLATLSAEVPAWQCLHALALHHLRVLLLRPSNDFIAVMLYEQRALTEDDVKAIHRLRHRYEAPWREQLQVLEAQGRLRASASMTRLMFFGALHGTLTWYDSEQSLALEELATRFMHVFVSQPD